MIVTIEGKELQLTNPEKLLWPELEIRKIDYIRLLLELSPYLLHYTSDRLLTSIRYPNGFNGKCFFQKNLPLHAPDWIPTKKWQETNYIVLRSRSVLTWLGNQAALEFHTPFNSISKENEPSSLVFDLDPFEGQPFEAVVEVALLVHHDLQALGIDSFPRTSGASGVQIYVPIGSRYDYPTARSINQFFANYFSQKYPQQITIERSVARRGKKLYFDYLQMWQGKTIITPYSPRATPQATVATPLSWPELEQGVRPEQFTLFTIKDRLLQTGDLLTPIQEDGGQNLDFILSYVNK